MKSNYNSSFDVTYSDLKIPLKLLIIEDSDLLRETFSAALGKNHTVYSVSTFKDGWKNYQENNPDIVFIDISLPDGSGHDLAYKIKQANPYAYIAMATASNYADDRSEAEFNNVDYYITKPYGRPQIEAVLQDYWTTRENVPIF